MLKLLKEPDSYAGCRTYNQCSLVLTSDTMHGSLFLGSSVAACNDELLRKNNIRYILTVSDDAKVVEIQDSSNIKHMRLPVQDTTKFSILPFFSQAFTFIDEALIQEKANILVHCACGISRSPTIVVAYLMRTMEWSLSKSMMYVRRKRQYTYPNKRFWLELVCYEHKLLKQRSGSDTPVPSTSITLENVHRYHSDAQRISLSFLEEEIPTPQ